MDNLKEEWRPVKDYEDTYEVSNTGKIRSKERYVPVGNRKFNDGRQVYNYYPCKERKISIDYSNKLPRHTVVLRKNNKYTCRMLATIMAEAFLINPYKRAQVRFRDGNSFNLTLDNLCWYPLRDIPQKHVISENPRSINKGISIINVKTQKVYKSITDAYRKTKQRMGAIRWDLEHKNLEWDYYE